jgi:hypothetical protein
LQYATESAIIRQFSSSVVPSTSVTWKSHVFPTIVTTGVCASSSALRHVSVSGGLFFRRVMPNAHTFACVRVSSRTAWKYSKSFGFDSGYPPSM